MIFIPFISLCIMFFSFQLDSWDGIITSLIMVYSFHKREIRGEIKREDCMSPVVNISNITCIHTTINPIIYLWLESSFRNSLWNLGLQQSNHAWTLSKIIKLKLDQILIRVWQMLLL